MKIVAIVRFVSSIKIVMFWVCVFFLLISVHNSRPNTRSTSHLMWPFTFRMFLVLTRTAKIEQFWAAMKLNCACDSSKTIKSSSFVWLIRNINQPTIDSCTMYGTCFRIVSKSNRSLSTIDSSWKFCEQVPKEFDQHQFANYIFLFFWWRFNSLFTCRIYVNVCKIKCYRESANRK